MRFRAVLQVLVFFMAAGLLMSPKLWLATRHYPLVPVWDRLPVIATPWDRIIFGAMLMTLGLGMVWRGSLIAFVLLAAAWSCWDQTRWQPWFFQYLFLLAALAFARAHQREAALNACRFILAATYFWSGLQKFNHRFASEVYPWVLQPLLDHLPAAVRDWALGQGWHAAMLECVLGIALLIGPLRTASAAILMAMHATLLACLGPWGHDWNAIVWPWNLAMMVVIGVLFFRTRSVPASALLRPRGYRFAFATLILFGLMPLLNFFNHWDSYFSAALYSGNTIQARIELAESAVERLPAEVREHYVINGEVQLQMWAMRELNVPPNPAERIFRGIASQLGSPQEVILEIDSRPDWRTGHRQTHAVP